MTKGDSEQPPSVLLLTLLGTFCLKLVPPAMSAMYFSCAKKGPRHCFAPALSDLLPETQYVALVQGAQQAWCRLPASQQFGLPLAAAAAHNLALAQGPLIRDFLGGPSPQPLPQLLWLPSRLPTCLAAHHRPSAPVLNRDPLDQPMHPSLPSASHPPSHLPARHPRLMCRARAPSTALQPLQGGHGGMPAGLRGATPHTGGGQVSGLQSALTGNSRQPPSRNAVWADPVLKPVYTPGAAETGRMLLLIYDSSRASQPVPSVATVLPKRGAGVPLALRVLCRGHAVPQEGPFSLAANHLCPGLPLLPGYQSSLPWSSLQALLKPLGAQWRRRSSLVPPSQCPALVTSARAAPPAQRVG